MTNKSLQKKEKIILSITLIFIVILSSFIIKIYYYELDKGELGLTISAEIPSNKFFSEIEVTIELINKGYTRVPVLIYYLSYSVRIYNTNEKYIVPYSEMSVDCERAPEDYDIVTLDPWVKVKFHKTIDKHRYNLTNRETYYLQAHYDSTDEWEHLEKSYWKGELLSNKIFFEA